MFQYHVDIQIPMQKYILIDNNLLIPLLTLNVRQIYNVFLTAINKFKNLIETSLEI